MSPARKKRVAAVVALAITLLAVLGPLTSGASAAVGDLQIVTATDHQDYGEVDNLDFKPAISADGRFIAYLPIGEDKGPGLFLRDMSLGTTTQVVAPPGLYNNTVRLSLSANGRYLAFESNAPVLFGEPESESAGLRTQVFIYDAKARRFTIASRRSGRNGQVGLENSGAPSISASGRRVVFQTQSHNLSTARPPIYGGIYERNLAAETLRPVSAVRGIEHATPGSWGPAISGNGRRIAFTLQYGRNSYNLPHPPHPSGPWLRRHRRQIMETDRSWNGPRLVSRASGRNGALADGKCGEAAISQTGRYVTFVSEARNLVPGDHEEVTNIFVRDMQTDRTTLVSTNSTGKPIADGDSSQPSISADGQWIAFLSEADNLDPGDTDTSTDIYAKNISTGRLVLITEGLHGAPSNGRFGGPAISANGQFVTFGSTSSNLSREVTAHNLALYRYEL
jgi:Tol biopolymer transport system component